MPIDPGVTGIEATAPGKKPWSMTATVKERDAITVGVPPLQDETPAVQPAAAPFGIT